MALIHSRWDSLACFIFFAMSISCAGRAERTRDKRQTRPKACPSDWFGPFCQFMCHCQNKIPCDAEGRCPNFEPCHSEYFGPGCQYRDLMKSKAKSNTPAWLTDGSERTCNNNKAATSLTVEFTEPVPFVLIRLQGNEPTKMIEFTIKMDTDLPCINEQRFTVSASDLDVVCVAPISMSSFTLRGEVVPTLCSIRISPGRNVALKQSASQSSLLSNNPENTPDRAVDGYTDSRLCAETNPEPKGSSWMVTFDMPKIISSVRIYPKIEKQHRPREFYLTLLNFYEEVVYSYTASWRTPDSVIRVDIPSQYHVFQVLIKSSNSTEIEPSLRRLALCEVEIMGETVCPWLRYGLDCARSCMCGDQDSVCSVLNGQCAQGCGTGRYGRRCMLECSDRCINQACYYTNGSCFECDTGYRGDACDQPCAHGTYGRHCRNNCSKNCADPCNPFNGRCENCKTNFLGQFCSNCVRGFWGSDCNKKCSSLCRDLRCTPDKGVCLGCVGMRSGNYCTACPVKFYGKYCVSECSEGCLNQTCDPDSGNCEVCEEGYSGMSCRVRDLDISEASQTWGYVLAVGVVTIVLALVITCCCNRYKKPRRNRQPTGPHPEGEHRRYLSMVSQGRPSDAMTQVDSDSLSDGDAPLEPVKTWTDIIHPKTQPRLNTRSGPEPRKESQV